MLVVSNTSPLCNLAIIGHLRLLREQFTGIRIPIAVRNELHQLSHANAAEEVQRALSEGWIEPQAVRDRTVVRARTRSGVACPLPLDEKDGRIAAERAGLPVTGGFGQIEAAKL
jgi:predicted nucleic acid-binding protein